MMKDNVRAENKPQKKQKSKQQQKHFKQRQNSQEHNILAKNKPKHGIVDRQRDPSYVRLKWKSPVLSATPIPKPICPSCKKPITDLAMSFTDRVTGEPIHFDCVVERIKNAEPVAEGESVTYLGGGRFGIIKFGVPSLMRSFKVKKVIEWENKDERALWRADIADHFSLT
ncbi:MAG: hypothetical protein Ta2B_20110 [Termitinemataceae bacterium]|nr:MAG: hypothetical protein Ta2B_20110 [Termitinemataceae bacterium]